MSPTMRGDLALSRSPNVLYGRSLRIAKEVGSVAVEPSQANFFRSKLDPC